MSIRTEIVYSNIDSKRNSRALMSDGTTTSREREEHEVARDCIGVKYYKNIRVR